MFVLETLSWPEDTWTTILASESYAVVQDKKRAVLLIRDEVFGTPDKPKGDNPIPPVRIRNDEVYPTPADLDDFFADFLAGGCEGDDGEVDDDVHEDFEDFLNHDHSMDY